MPEEVGIAPMSDDVMGDGRWRYYATCFAKMAERVTGQLNGAPSFPSGCLVPAAISLGVGTAKVGPGCPHKNNFVEGDEARPCRPNLTRTRLGIPSFNAPATMFLSMGIYSAHVKSS